MKNILLLVLLMYAIVLLISYLYQYKLIFHPTKLPQDFVFDTSHHAQEVFLTTDDHEKINGIYKSNNHKKAVLYFHGNAGVLNTWQHSASIFDGMPIDVLIIDYRGYGKSTGTPSEQGLYKDAEAAYDFLIGKGYNRDSIIVFGRSLGTGVAMHVVRKFGATQVVLETPYSSMLELATQKYPFLLPRITLRHRFNTIQYAEQFQGKMLVIHGTDDELIPLTHSERIKKVFADRCQLLIIDGGAHSNLSQYDEYKNALSQFLVWQ